MTVKEWCSINGVSAPMMYYWMGRLGKEDLGFFGDPTRDVLSLSPFKRHRSVCEPFATEPGLKGDVSLRSEEARWEAPHRHVQARARRLLRQEGYGARLCSTSEGAPMPETPMRGWVDGAMASFSERSAPHHD